MTATATTLVVLAAGRGTRFGGAKQLVAVLDDGSTITDILLRRAAAAGVERAAMVVNADIESRVRSHLDAIRPDIAVEVIIQRRPRGTADAVFAARDATSGPIIVVNADDLYPASAFGSLVAHLRDAPACEHAAVGFRLDRTRVGMRPESRALLDADDTGVLRRIRETQIERQGDGGFSTRDSPELVAGDHLVSMNIWAFRQSIFGATEAAIAEREEHRVGGEVFLPDVVASMLESGETVRVLRSGDTCVGLTYPEDVDAVRSAL